MPRRHEAGNVYSHLTVLHRCTKEGVNPKCNHSYWLCRCKCGNLTKVRVDHLRKQVIKSCGCLSNQRFRGEPYRKVKQSYKSEIDAWSIGIIIFIVSFMALFVLYMIN